jgi:sugar-specific transcriptional regulator TrmB
MHMQGKHLSRLEKMGLFRAEAQIYLALLRKSGPMRASDIVAGTGVPRGSIYAALTRLTDIGLVEAEAGYGGRFSAIPADKALSLLIARSRDELLQREEMANELADELKSVADPSDLNGESEQIQVLRDARVVAERFERLQREAKRTVEAFVKAPILNPSLSNPSQKKGLQRGVQYRGLYERAIMDAPEIKPYLSHWIAAGEQVRIHHGELPHKLAIFDRQNILMPLFASNGHGRTLFIRHPQLGMSFGMFFDFLWARAEPLHAGTRKKSRTSRTTAADKDTKQSKSGTALL